MCSNPKNHSEPFAGGEAEREKNTNHRILISCPKDTKRQTTGVSRDRKIKKQRSKNDVSQIEMKKQNKMKLRRQKQ